MNFYVDLDNTFFDYTRHYITTHYAKTGIIVTQSALEKHGYDLHTACGISDKNKFDYLKEEDFFFTMQPYDNAVDVIDNLKRSHNVNIIFVTHLVTLEAYAGKVKALRRLFPWFDFERHLITARDKHNLIPGVILDDNAFVLKDSYGHHVTIAYDHHWNKNVESDYRICKWDSDLEELIVGLI